MMDTNARSSRLTIFEGPDGSGKSTAAKQWAEATDARYVHFSAYPLVHDSLFAMYVEAMIPALLGYQDLVFDRSWYSEVPYGNAYRNGSHRLTPAQISVLDRLALRCGAVMVLCDTNVDTILQTFRSRKQVEYLDNELQLVSVVNEYRKQQYGLPIVKYDRTVRPNEPMIDRFMPTVSALYTPRGPLNTPSWTGCLDSEIMIIVPRTEHKRGDPFYQWPGCSVAKDPHQKYITDELKQADISELDLQWCFADEVANMFEFRENAFYIPKDWLILGDETWNQMSDAHDKLLMANVTIFDSVIPVVNHIKDIFK